MTKILDHGYVDLVEHWGSDERIIEAARMSVDKGFISWEPYEGHPKGDAGLLRHLYMNNHSTPFEMAGLIIEVKAPIFVFREWHRHRTQSYNEMSARYIPLPDENYMPSGDRLFANLHSANKQAQGTGASLTPATAARWLESLDDLYIHAQRVYEQGIAAGIPKELARLPVPVARYSRMRASANLRNWLGFLTLRDHPAAQWEIREYAHEVANIIQSLFPRTYALFEEKNNVVSSTPVAVKQ
jgi:thymidylate synthase (FAD)